MTRIRGQKIILIDKVASGTDPFGKTLYEDVEIEVDNVIIAPISHVTNEIITQLNLEGRRAVYTLGIPKGDTHDWENKEVRFFGQRWQTFGIPVEGMEDLIPLEWNKKVMVERFGQSQNES